MVDVRCVVGFRCVCVYEVCVCMMVSGVYEVCV